MPPVSSGKQQSIQSVAETADTNSGCKNTGNLTSPEILGQKDQATDHLKLFSPGKTTVLQVTLGKKGEIFVQPSPGAGPRSPTISECKDIIHHLEDTNRKQGQEVG